MVNSTEMAATLREFISDEMGLDPEDYELDTPLFTAGLLDSFNFIVLLSFVEQRFEIRLQLSEDTAAQADTLRGMTKLITQALVGANDFETQISDLCTDPRETDS